MRAHRQKKLFIPGSKLTLREHFTYNRFYFTLQRSCDRFVKLRIVSRVHSAENQLKNRPKLTEKEKKSRSSAEKRFLSSTNEFEAWEGFVEFSGKKKLSFSRPYTTILSIKALTNDERADNYI